MKLCVVAVILLASVYSVSSAHDGECQYVYIAQPPPELNCNPSGDSRLQLACSLYLGSGIVPGRLEFLWFFSLSTETLSMANQILTSVAFDAGPRQNFTSRIVVFNPPSGFYFCQPRNPLEHFNLSISTVARVLVDATKPLCVLGEFTNISTPECAQQNFTVDALENINATADMTNTDYVNMTAVATTQPTSDDGLTTQTNDNINLQVWIYIMIGAISLVVFVVVVCICTLSLICCRCIRKRRNKRKTKFVNSRLSPHDRCTNSPTDNTTESVPLSTLSRDISSTTNTSSSQLQLLSRSNMVGQNFPPPPSNPPPVLDLQQLQQAPQDYVEPTPNSSLSRENYYSKLKSKKGRPPNSVVSTTSTHTHVDGDGYYIQGPGRREDIAGLEEDDGGHSTEYLSIKRDSDISRRVLDNTTESQYTESKEYYNQQVYNPRGGHSADPQRQNEQYRRLVENNKRGAPRLEDETSFSDSQPRYLNWKKK